MSIHRCIMNKFYDENNDITWINDNSLDIAREWLSGVIESVYETGDVDELERCLEELCDNLDVKFNPPFIKLQKKTVSPLMKWYLDNQQKYLKEVYHG